jgi:predicted ester cyclase
MTHDALLRTWFEEVWNRKDESAIDRILHPRALAHGLFDDNGQEVIGPENFKSFFRRFIASFPSIQVKVIDTISEGDKGVALCEVTMSHSGADFPLDASHALKAANQPVSFGGVSVVKIKDGQFIESWNHFDFLSMYMQLNAIKFTGSEANAVE